MFSRPEERFAYLRREGATCSSSPPAAASSSPRSSTPTAAAACPRSGSATSQSLYANVEAAGTEVHIPLEQKWYLIEDELAGNYQFVVADPDGYLLRFTQDLGRKPV